MRFRNSLRLLMENFKHVYHLLFSKFLIALVACALCCSFVLPEMMRIWDHTVVQELLSQLKEFFTMIFTANFSELESVKQEIFGAGGSISEVGALLSTMTWEIVWTVVGCVAVYLLKRFAETVCYFTTGSRLNDKMATYAETKYTTALVANLGKASVYALIYVPCVFLFDVLTVGLCYCVLRFLPMAVGLFLVVTVIVLLQALKMTVVGAWMPGLTENKKLASALHEEKEEKQRKIKVFSGYLVAAYAIIVVNVVAAICTFGSALLLTVPASYFFLICLQYVNYYTLKGKKYFLTYENIASNPDHGDSEHFFDYLEETQASEGEGGEDNKDEK